MPSAPICILNDLTMPLPLYSPHNFGPLPPIPPLPPPTPAVCMSPFPASALDLPATMLWPPGNLVFKNKYSTTVTHKFLGIIQTGHDLGIMILHIQVAPGVNNFFTPLHILFSSRKVMFSSSSVKVNGAFVGLAGLIGLPPTPMMVCGEPTGFPVGEVLTRWMNTVWVGFTWIDVLLGVVNIAVSIVVDRLLSPKPGAAAVKKVEEDLAAGLAAQIYKKMFPIQSIADVMASKSLTKLGVGFAMGIVSMIAQGEGSTSITLGSSYASVQLSVQRDAAGNWGASLKGQVPMVSETAAVKEGTGGSMQANVNWGSGGGSAQQTASGSKIAAHNTFRGETTGEEKSKK
jgi:hypothetical protein